tara:strand:- start:241 stop:2622 length:2382 start_codon:yes stop_codon:yes gene_type:complete
MDGVRPIYIPVQQSGSGSGKAVALLLISGGGLLLLLLFIVVVLLLIYRQRQKRTADARIHKRISEVTAEQVEDRVRIAAEETGHDPDVLEAELKEQVEEQAAKSCMVNPIGNGQCSPNYTLENGCCYPDASAPPNPNIAKIEMAKTLAIAVGGGLIVEAMLVAAATRAARGAKAGVTGAKAGLAGAKAAKAAITSAKLATAGVKGGVVAAKAGAAVGKASVAARGGPIGIAVAVAMLIFDAISIALDLTDQGGYDSQTTNSTLDKIKRIIDYETQKALEKEGIEYPLLFPLAVAYPEDFAVAMEYAMTQVNDKHMLEELLKDDALLNIVADFTEEAEVDPNTEIPEEFVTFLSGLSMRFHLERDTFIFQKLQEILGPKSYMIELYEGMSTPDRIAVTLSQRGVQEWNDQSKETWFANNDLFKQPDPLPAGDDPMAALYTDTYYVYESGPSDNPTMVPKTLPYKVAIAGFYGGLISFCEKSRKIKSTSPTIDPLKLGVEYQYDTGVCKLTREYCSRYGLEFKGGDCHLRPGQGVAELIFGQVVTREFIRAFTSPPSYAKKSQGPATVGACPSGMRDDGINCWLDPVYRGPGSPMGCKDGQEKKGQLCYSKCRDEYNSSALECEGSCPDGSENSGFHCTQWIHSYIPGNKSSNPFSKGFYQRAGCRDGFTYRGTTCNEVCLPDFDFRSGALGTAFCNKTRGRYSRAGDAKPLSSCPADKEKQGLLCYDKCSNKGDQGQYKYNGVLDWCQPEGAAGIKKGLDDRWECPEGSHSIAGICYKDCKPGERDDGLLCNPP